MAFEVLAHGVFLVVVWVWGVAQPSVKNWASLRCDLEIHHRASQDSLSSLDGVSSAMGGRGIALSLYGIDRACISMM